MRKELKGKKGTLILCPCKESDLDALMRLQEEICRGMEHPDW